jgi:hypothetical protein
MLGVMPKQAGKTPKRPRDPNQRAMLIVDIVTGESDEPKAPPEKDPAAVERGKARSASLPPSRRSEIAKKAAEARWATQRGSEARRPSPSDE